jgi:hypothetical protein
VNASTALATRTSSVVAPLSADEEVDLAALLDLFTSEDSEEGAAVAAGARRSIRSEGARLRAWAEEWVRRATAWGAGPGGAWRAW